MNQPLLHVMIPAYGKSPYLKDALDSISNKYLNFAKFTVVEDPSEFKDVENLLKNYPQILYVKNQNRLGIAGNFNKCLELSEGIYTQILGSDDILNNEIDLKVLQNKVSNLNTDLIINRAKIINDKGVKKLFLTDFIKHLISPKSVGPLSTKKFMLSLAVGDWAYFPAIYWKTNSIRKLLFSDKYHTAMDLKIFYEMCKHNFSISTTKIYGIYYRRHKNSASVNYSNSPMRFIEEYDCQSFGRSITINNKWKIIDFILRLSLGIRLHIFIKLLKFNQMNLTEFKEFFKLFIKKIEPTN